MSQPPYPPPPDSSGQPGYQPGYQPAGYVPDHPQATTALVLGILGLVLCGVVAPFAWVMGGRAVREIDESHGTVGGRGTANAGRILGIIGTVLLVLSVVAVIAVVALGAVASVSSS